MHANHKNESNNMWRLQKTEAMCRLEQILTLDAKLTMWFSIVFASSQTG